MRPPTPLSLTRPPQLVAVTVLFLGVSQTSHAPDVSREAVIEAATAYVSAYQEQLTSVLADETYTQQVVRQVPFQPGMPRKRTLQSELFFMFASGGGWMAIRDVISVDGEPARGRPDIKEALRRLPAREVATTFKSYNSRFNLGRTFRNFNEPTLALLVLDPEHRSRFRFDRTRLERTADAVLITMAFSEKERPTLIHDLKAGPVFSRGELTIEAGSGRIRRATLAAKIRSVRLELVTEYAPQERLGIWAPAVFRERYEYGEMRAGEHEKEKAASSGRREYEQIVCEAMYTNYRRFETSVRVK